LAKTGTKKLSWSDRTLLGGDEGAIGGAEEAGRSVIRLLRRARRLQESESKGSCFRKRPDKTNY
jgi:hypothetical protein